MSIDVTLSLIKELRDTTGISVMQCKNALEEAEGDMEKALAILKKTSSDIALKKAGRDAKDGRVYIKSENKKSILIALHCETDFVSKNEDFINLLSNLANKVSNEGIEKTKEEATEMINPVIQKTGEKIELGDIYEIKGEILGNYVHNHKVAVVVSLENGNEELARDIAMHITAMKPEYISKDEITEDVKKTITEIFEKEVSEINKPEDIKKKMLEGKINTYFKEKTLLSQTFIKNGDETIEQLLDKNKAKIIEVKRYSI
ncbi:MAG: Elongation factor Ts [Candidatus Nomurabacteria bacterium GW2011_GWE1_32_28]|uniref:Elongation factor Ts n=1 Tax=Candidatus Nomurabacteria bacterium GW2011_GWF1_31_48 TaxID=1618767 RepID=A0A0G0AU97_9BACT|nr:MAG: Elongation factor Ts [Candidatus Nomurabacteria bacterium GW2011_GWF2_30_133]KKP28604.1 MAG: Elongation factor Ts [Candidatus Nomurabacteria bacterium GW2011_GWE2_31_40]KKP30180.1 MAG: Elongation factor Ts [Candidatus Nomurabacteria bacterium GW2011_GWF1_31_48]KKP34706.1 MAG: Elongation factor Ts [Candidatus Nomurabacteria bacterium GW2011_GWE1_32_28]HAS80835.1 translation elongation factor Ts [Candidatus Nomurabacteria bacterium]